MTSSPRYQLVSTDIMETFREKYLGLYKEHDEERGGVGLDYEALYLIAYK